MADPVITDPIIGLIRGKLISQHYLTHQLPSRDDWKTVGQGPRAAEVEALFEKVRPQLSKNKPSSKGSNEEAVRGHLLNYVFEVLGLRWSPGVHYFLGQLDYVLFHDQPTYEKAQSLINEGRELDALKLGCGIVESERWGKEFEERPRRADLSDPITQIEFYLGNARRSGGPRWGILTNGHTWRLYCGDSDPLRHDYLEIELPTERSLFAEQHRETFKLLVYFFSVEALQRGGRLDGIYDQATRRAAAITAELRRQAYGAVELLASAIMRTSPSASPQLAYEAALIQLFRLLFILKAEADGLLAQRKVSEDIAERIVKQNGESIGDGDWDGKNFWHELRDIFEAIAQQYNGHLFESKPPTSSPAADEGADHFAPARALLESVVLPNQAVANAIDRLLRVYHEDAEGQVHPVRVDYSTLRVRELGTIYEGLLEWQLQPVSPAQIKAGSVKLLGDKHISRVVEAGDYTLVADQSDRKATGSYYTPHYVVEFIGKNVLDPLLREIEEESKNEPAEIISRVLNQRILDPAMGSGHFLVFAVEYLASYVDEQLGRIRAERKLNEKGKKKAGKEQLPVPADASIEFVRARIAERCIYGVDINPLAVELAKLSLWVATAAKGVPLSFLNHHLRCGDSLLGVFSEEFHDDLFEQRLEQRIALAVGHIRLINELYTQTLQDVGKKEEKLRAAREHLRRFRLAYDSKIDQAFGHDIDIPFHGWLEHMSEPVPSRLPDWLQGVEEEASRYRFFHWELEFPEVWHDRFGRPLPTVAAVCDRQPGAQEGRRSQSAATIEDRLAGFDVILGNPPFVRAKDELARRAYMERWTTAIKGFHLLVPFFERAFQILRPIGHLGFIVSNAFAKREFGKNLVEEFLPQYRLEEVVDCSGLTFPGHGTPTCIVFARAAKPSVAAVSPPPDGAQRPPVQQTARVTTTLKGDLRTPPEDSPLWRSTVAHHTQPGYRDAWIAVADVPQRNLAVHPWRFSEENERTREQLESVPHKCLRKILADEVGYGCITRTDDVFIQPPWVLRRFRIEVENIRQLGTGESLRDWSHDEFPLIIFPYDAKLRAFDPEEHPNTIAFLESYKETLENVIMHGTVPKKQTRINWFEYSRLGRAKCGTPLSIAIPEIATHNHAYFDQSGVIFHQTAPVLKLGANALAEDHELLAGVLNSSAALFWLKQICFNKGSGEEERRDRFVYAGRKLEQLPIPEAGLPCLRESNRPAVPLVQLPRRCRERGRQLFRLSPRRIFEKQGEAYDAWNRALPWYTAPHLLIAQPFGTAQELLALKAKAKEERERLRREMIALQEEMDWLVYAAYGLLPQEHPAVGLGVMDAEHPWEVALGQRPFELVAINAGPPGDWEEKRKHFWLARMEAIGTNEHIARIERPIYKRRWVPPDYEKEFAEAFKWWLREKAEFFLEHVVNGGPVSLEDWAAALWTDQRIRAAAEAYNGSPPASSKKFEPILKEAIEEETVPDDETAFKPRHKRLRGKLNVPRERFRSLTSKPDHYIWAGK